MQTNLYIDRIAALRTQVLSTRQVGEVLGRGDKYAKKLLSRNLIGHTEESVGVNAGPDHKGKNFRREVPVGAMLIYLVKISKGDRTDLLEAIRLRFPAFHPMCVQKSRDLDAASAPLPPAVVDAREAFSKPAEARSARSRSAKEAKPTAFYSQDLFDPDVRHTQHPTLLKRA